MSTGKVGRPAQPILYVDINHDGNDYTVGIVTPECSDNPLAFVFDKDMEKIVKSRSWHRCSTTYIASTAKDPHGAQCQLFLHNLVMGKTTFAGRGQAETVDHINRIGFDNRKENLRIITQSEQNMNQRRRPRVAKLPEDCGFTMDDVPRHIWYIKPSGAHGNRFAIEFKSEGIVWKTTSSKTKTLHQKLEEALVKLAEFYTIYPHLDPENDDKLIHERYLVDTFHAIVDKAKHSVGLIVTEDTYITHV